MAGSKVLFAGYFNLDLFRLQFCASNTIFEIPNEITVDGNQAIATKRLIYKAESYIGLGGNNGHY